MKCYPGDSFGQEASPKIRLYLQVDPYTLLANLLSLQCCCKEQAGPGPYSMSFKPSRSLPQHPPATIVCVDYWLSPYSSQRLVMAWLYTCPTSGLTLDHLLLDSSLGSVPIVFFFDRTGFSCCFLSTFLLLALDLYSSITISAFHKFLYILFQ